MSRWKNFTCGVCRGHGIVSDYSGGDFQGERDCEYCGYGTVWVSERDRLAKYVGGPLLGSWPGKFKAVA